jgi:hypothetical protein
VIEKKAHNNGSSNLEFNSKLEDILFEKTIALEAINKIHLFFDEKKINSYEKDKLLSKYNKLLDHYDKQIFQDKPSSKIQESSDLHNQFMQYVSPPKDMLNKKLNNLLDIPRYINKREEEKNDSHIRSLYSKKSNLNNNNNKNNQELFTDSLDLSTSNNPQSINDLRINERKNNKKSITSTKKISSMNNQNYFIDDSNNNKDTEFTNVTHNSKINEIDKIQDEILKTLKRLEDS